MGNKGKLVLLTMLVMVASAEAASGTTGTTTYFQGLWNVITAILGDTYMGYIGALIGVGAGMNAWWQNQPAIQVAKPAVLGIALGSITGLSQALAGALL